MAKLVTIEQMRAIEQEGNASGYSYTRMMNAAGKGVGDHIHSKYGKGTDKIAIGLVGAGNNGGDTLVALTRLAELGWKTRAYLARPRAKEDMNLQNLLMAGGEIANFEQDRGFSQLDEWLRSSNVLLDGILGTGTRLPLQTEFEKILEHVREFTPRPPVIAIDCPSGVHCESGAASPAVIPANETICIEAVKTGLLKFPAFDLAGSLYVVPLGLPQDLPTSNSIHAYVISAHDVASALPTRSRTSHKGTFGTLLILGGSQNYTGAPGFSAEAAYRIGTGLVQVALPASIQPVVAANVPEAVWLPLPHQEGAAATGGEDQILTAIQRATAVIIGPGLGNHPATAELIQQLMLKIKSVQPKNHTSGQPIPFVIDADGLRLIAKIPDWPNYLPAGSILTPHPGEMSALTGLTVNEIADSRVEIASKYAVQWGHIVILKGAFTVVAHPNGQVSLLAAATASLAKAGTGDVLAGLIGGLLAQGVPPYQAARSAVWIHAKAGIMAGEIFQQTASVLARDVTSAVPKILARLSNGMYLPGEI